VAVWGFRRAALRQKSGLANTHLGKTMANENGDGPIRDALDDSGGISDAELIGALGLSEELGGAEGDDDGDLDEGDGDASDDADAGGENDSDDDGDDADDEDADSDQEDGENDDSEKGDESDDEDEEDADGEEEELEKLPTSVKALQKRVNKLTSRAKSAEEARTGLETEVKDLKEKLEKAAPVMLQPTGTDPLSDLMTPEAVNDRVGQMKQLREWCLENLEGGTVNNGKEDVELSAKDVRKRLTYAEQIINEQAPARLQYLQQLGSCEKMAREIFPALFDDKTEDSKIASNFLRACPEIMRLPNYQTIIGDALRGMRVREKEAEAAKAKKPGEKKDAEKKKAPVPKAKAQRAIAPAPAKSTTNTKAKASRSERQFMQSGNKADLENMILSSLG